LYFNEQFVDQAQPDNKFNVKQCLTYNLIIKLAVLPSHTEYQNTIRISLVFLFFKIIIGFQDSCDGSFIVIVPMFRVIEADL